MDSRPHSKSRFLPIAIAEGGSTGVSLAALWALERNEGLLAPLQQQLSQALFYPDLRRRHQPSSPDQEAELQRRAMLRASVTLKGVAMIGTGFVAHLPIQLALEGKVDGVAFRQAAVGKGAGVAVALGSIIALNKFAPSAMASLQNALTPILKPFLPKDRKSDSHSQDEVAKLLIVDLTSSAIAGLANYAITRKR